MTPERLVEVAAPGTGFFTRRRSGRCGDACEPLDV